jgi:hypothetical protein
VLVCRRPPASRLTCPSAGSSFMPTPQQLPAGDTRGNLQTMRRAFVGARRHRSSSGTDLWRTAVDGASLCERHVTQPDGKGRSRLPINRAHLRRAALCRSPQDLVDPTPLPDLHGETFALTGMRPCYREFGLEDRLASYLTPPAPPQSPLIPHIDTQ